jgi:hypothetical protein
LVTIIIGNKNFHAASHKVSLYGLSVKMKKVLFNPICGLHKMNPISLKER